MSDWGPEYPCPRCGTPVQTYSGYRVRFARTFLAGTWQPHVCHDPLPERQIRQCPDCYEPYDATLLSERPIRWSEHECHRKPQPQPVPTPIPAPVKVEMAHSRLRGIAHDLQ